MGVSISWCAVREEAAEPFLQDLGLTPTGDTEEFPASLISVAKLDTDWRVLWYNKYGCPFLTPEHLSRLSISRDILFCLVEEHVMASSAELWSGGKRLWWLSHEGEGGPRGLACEGKLPEFFPAIREKMEEQQRAAGGDHAGVDYLFEIPLKVAEGIAGFKHDDDWPHVIGGRLHVVSGITPRTGLLGRLFKR